MGDELSVPLVMGSVDTHLLRQLRAHGQGGDDLSALARVIEDRIDWQVRTPQDN
jgi:hypothetical protein